MEGKEKQSHRSQWEAVAMALTHTDKKPGDLNCKSALQAVSCEGWVGGRACGDGGWQGESTERFGC